MRYGGGASGDNARAIVQMARITEYAGRFGLPLVRGAKKGGKAPSSRQKGLRHGRKDGCASEWKTKRVGKLLIRDVVSSLLRPIGRKLLLGKCR